MDFYLYILKCVDGSYYIGHTNDIQKRIAEHNDGKASAYTATRLPVTIVYTDTFQTRRDAFLVERKIKKWRREKKEAFIRQHWNELQACSKKKFT